MKIGIIGTGNIGSILAQKLSAVGHDVRIANSRGVEGAKQVAVEVGAKAVDVYGAVAGMDVVILSIPFFAVTALPADLFSAVGTDVVLIDTGNYYPGMRDPYIPDIDNGMPESV